MSEEDFGALEERIHGMITSNNGEITNTDTMGVRRLAYPIKKLVEGKYMLVYFKAGSEVPGLMSKQLKLLQTVIRFMIVNLEE